jgi:type II secretory pathway pseudopilin PulG
MNRIHKAAAVESFKRQFAFTLLEILIAMTIFFAAATSGLLAYQNAMSSSLKAEQVVKLLTYVESVQQQVFEQLQSSPQTFPQQGEGRFMDIQYSWKASLAKKGPPPDDYDAETGVVIYYKPRFSLVDIELVLQSDSTERDFHYQELLWLPVAERQQASP